MKITFILTLISTLGLSAGVSYSQETKLSLKLNNATLEELLNEIGKKSEFSFWYSHKELGNNNKVSLAIKDQTIDKILDMALKDQNLTYEIKDKVIIISKPRVLGNEVTSLQQQKLTGTVTDAGNDNEPLPGVNVTVEGTTIGTVTDASGGYTIEVPNANAVLVFSFVGYNTEKVTVAGKATIDVSLIADITALEDVVVIGYGTVKKKDLSGAVGVVKADQLDQSINTNVGSALQGKIAGVSIMSNSGQPGSSTSIRVRGLGSVNNNDPLIIIDDSPVIPISEGSARHDPLSSLNPNDIESIQVLKDASAAAIYGTRAANGVILVTTKSGKKGGIKLEANADFGVQQIGKKLDLCNADEWLKIMNKLYEGQTENLPGIVKNPPLTGVGTDWQDEAYRVAPMQNYSINASGGSDNLTYNVSLGYLNQEGIMINTGYDRLNMRIKTDFTKGRFKFGESLTISKEKYNLMPGDQYSDLSTNIVTNITNMSPVVPVKEADGFWGGATDNYTTGNPIALLNLTKYTTDWARLVTNLYGEFTIFDGLKYKCNVSINNDIGNTLFSREEGTLGRIYFISSNNVRNYNRNLKFWQVENTLSFVKTLAEKHSLNVVIGQSAYENHFNQFSSYKAGMPDDIWSLDAGTTSAAVSGNEKTNTLASYFGRVNYSYDNRYIFTGTFRRDGSSRFGRSNPWANFPSLSVAWNIANEEFFKNAGSPVSELKLRGSWGKLGNQEIGDYAYIQNVAVGQDYSIGNPATVFPGSIQRDAVSTNLRWEATSTTNVGLDLGLWNGKLNYSLDVFQKTTTDMLLTKDLPMSAGFYGNPIVNAGEISNKGYEMMISYNGSKGDFTYFVTGTMAHVKNKVVDLIAKSDTYREGFPLYGFFLVKTDGIFKNQAEIDAYTYTKDGVTTLIQPNAKPGDVKFVDANNDGKISTGTMDGDKVYCGSRFPAYEFGLRFEVAWKFLDASFYLQGTQGNKVFNGNRMEYAPNQFYTNYSTALLNSYSFDPNSDVSRLVLVDANGAGITSGNSDLWLEDGSYCRLKTMQIGVTLPDALIKKMSIAKCRFYIAADNLFTITNYKGYNPEVGVDGGSSTGSAGGVYPLSKIYHFGLQLNF